MPKLKLTKSKTLCLKLHIIVRYCGQNTIICRQFVNDNLLFLQTSSGIFTIRDKLSSIIFEFSN